MGIRALLSRMDRWGWLAVIVLCAFSFSVGLHFSRTRGQVFLLSDDAKEGLVGIARLEMGAEGNYTVLGPGRTFESSGAVPGRRLANVFFEAEDRDALLTIDVDSGTVVQRFENRAWMARARAPSLWGRRWAHDRLVTGHGGTEGLPGAPPRPTAHPFLALALLLLVVAGLVHVARWLCPGARGAGCHDDARDVAAPEQSMDGPDGPDAREDEPREGAPVARPRRIARRPSDG